MRPTLAAILANTHGPERIRHPRRRSFWHRIVPGERDPGRGRFLACALLHLAVMAGGHRHTGFDLFATVVPSVIAPCSASPNQGEYHA